MSRLRPTRAASAAAIFASFSVLACGTIGDASEGEQVAQGSLGAPTATFPEDFGTIQSVREMSDGRVLVADPLAGSLFLVDMNAGTRSVIGTEGQGPGEYRQPDAVWALPGDSTLLVDLGNGRMISLGPDLTFGPTSPLSSGDPRSGMVIAIPQGVDAAGNVYSRSMGGMGGALADSGAVLRIVRGSMALDTVASFKLEGRTQATSGGANDRSVQIQAIPLSTQDSWGVAADGSVAIARSSDYHVEWFGADGTITRGAPFPVDRISIGTAEKEEWVRSQGQSGGGLGISVEVNNGAMSMSFQRGGGGGGGREIDQYQWPESKPPFDATRLQVDAGDRVWVRRHVAAGADATFDVFNRAGEYVTTYTLPNNKRVIGFGARSVYVVAYDEFDLNYLERYTMPSM
ncbi:MAG: hypothetical protein O2958_09375 [Gemmatimonadetes bacterium]|nr:hypothetical protein [Gemmatimonadota bacterium]MDA1103520.1 hypothetical protein [Gemmatimonadota bacterium]